MRTAHKLTTLLLIFCALAANTALAQDDDSMGYSDREAAEHYFAKEGYATAVDFFKKAYGSVKTADEKAEMIYWVGQSYRSMDDQVQAEVWYKRAIKAQYADPMAHYYVAKSQQKQGRFEEALETFDNYKEKGGDVAKAEAGIASVKYAMEQTDKPSKYVTDPALMLNTEFYDFAPAFTGGEGSELVLCSSRLGSTGIEEFKKTGESYEDFFVTKKDEKGKWAEPGRMGSNLNTIDHEGAACFTSDGMRMYFTKCYQKKNEGCDIWMSTKDAEGKWGESKLVSLKGAEEKENTFGHPALSSDDQVMVFASDRPGGQGGKDLWMSKYNGGSNSWGAPVNLGPKVNTSGDEMFPYIRNNGSLYFSSNGHTGMGALDLFIADKTGDNEWSNVKNMGYPMNSNSNDFGIIFDGDFERGYFTSDRAGGKGKDDIYEFSLPEVLFAFEGIVYDKDNQQPLVNSYVRVVGSDGSSFEANTDGNGSFIFGANGDERYINPDVNYSIEVGKEKYLVAKDNISTVNLSGESTNFVKEFFLQPVIEGKGISMPEVQYELAKWQLLPQSRDSLDYLYNIMSDNPTIVVQLEAHTDSRGSDADNQNLSQKRAQSCVDYLISKGIPGARMKARGFGESRLRISDAQIAAAGSKEEKERLHQLNRRTEFSILSWDYSPK